MEVYIKKEKDGSINNQRRLKKDGSIHKKRKKDGSINNQRRLKKEGFSPKKEGFFL